MARIVITDEHIEKYKKKKDIKIDREKEEAKASLPASNASQGVADRASYYLSARNTEDKKPTFGERLGYGAKSIHEKTKATPDLLYQGIKGTIADSENEELQKAEARRMAMEKLARQMDIGYHNEGVLAPGGEAVTQADIIAAGVENAQKREHELMSKIDPDSYGYKTYTKGVEAQEKATAGLGKFGKFIADTLISVGDNVSVMPLAMIPGVGSPATLGAMSAKASAGRAYELTREGRSAREALTRGLISGGIEALTEKMPLDNLLDAVKIGGTPFISTALKQMGTEASEESASYILNYLTDYTAGDPNASFSLGELMESALAGAISGGIMGGGASLINRAVNGGASLVNRAVNGNTAFIEDNDPRRSLPVVEARQDAPAVAKTDNTEKGVLSDSDGISEEGVKLVSEEEIVAQRPQANSDDAVMEFARETVAKRQENQQADREAIEYNVRNATGYGEQGVKAVADIVEKTNADTVEIDRAFRTAYETGLTGIERSKVELVNEIQEKAYTAGYLDYTAEMGKLKSTQAMVRKDGGVFPDDKKLYKNLPTQTYNSLNRIGKALGTAIVMDDTLTEQQQGYYNAKDGSIHISTNVENAVMEVFKHEVTHRMQELAPTEYVAFRSFVYESLNEGRTSSTTLAEAKRAQYASMDVNEDISGSIDEVVAAFTEELFADEQKLHNFIAEVTGDETKRSWAQKFFDIIREVIDKVKGALRKGDTSIADSIKQFEKAEQMWKDTMKASVKNVSLKNAADGSIIRSENGKRYSLSKEPVYITDKTDKPVRDEQKWQANKKKAIEYYRLTDEESFGIDQYVSGHAYTWTRIALGEEESNPWHEYCIEQAIAGLKKMPEYSGRTYRNLVFSEKQKYDTFMSEYEEGNIVQFISLVSASKEPNGYVVRGEYPVHLVIDGVSGRDIAENFSIPGQQEVTYLPGTKLHIDSVGTANDGAPLIFVTEVTKNGKDLGQNYGGRRESSNRTDETGNRNLSEGEGDVLGGIRAVGREPRDARTRGKSEIHNSFDKSSREKEVISKNVKYSLKDSSNRELTQEQQAFYADSKILDKDGNLLVLYHGTGADFTVFDTKRAGQNYDEWSEYGKGIYLTPSTKLAKYYAENARGGKTKTMELYANIENPFNVTKAVEFDIDDLAEKYGLTEFDVSFLKRAGYRLTDFLREHNEDITEYLTSKGHDGLWDMERGKATQVVAYKENQVKNVDNKKPTDNPDIRFSLKAPREETKNLIALHNLTEQNLWDSLKIGGFPLPSIAVVKAKSGHSKYGAVSLIFGKDTIDPQKDKRNKVYGGDAYTPTFPAVEYPVNFERVRAVEQEIAKLSEQVANGIFSHSSVLRSRGIENESSMDTDALAKKLAGVEAVQAAYFAEQGKTLEPILQDKVFDSYGNDALKSYLNNEGYQEVARLNAKIATGESLSTEELETARDAIMKHWIETHEYGLRNKPELREMRIAKQREKISDIRTEDFIIHALEMYEDGGATKGEVDKLATAEAMTNKLFEMSDGEGFDSIERMIEPWIKEKLGGVLGEAGIYNGQDRHTRTGTRKSFEQLHYAYTLENIVKAMKETQPERGGQTWGITAGTLQATASKTYKSIADIKKDSDRLGAIEGEEYTARVESVEDEIKSVIQQVRKTNKPHSDNTFEEEEIIGSILMDAAQTKKTINSIVQTFAKEGYTIGNQTAKDIQTLYKNAAALPTEYFEAKPQRAVGFDEVLAAVVPDNIEAQLVTALEQQGVAVLTYKSGDESDRLKVVNSVENARFSLKDDKDILKENAKLKEINAALKAQFKTTKFAKVDKKALERFTKQLLKDYSSQADAGETRLMLDGLYQYMASGENGECAVWEDVYKQAREIANDVLRKSVEVDDEMYREYADLRKYLRETPISISSEDVADIDGVESLQEFRKKYWGRIRISNDGIRIDDIYGELSAEYPALFDAETETHPGAQFARIGQVLDEMRPVEYNPYSSNIGQTADYMAYDIVDRFFELPQAKPTFADKAERKLTETRIREGKKLENLRTQKNERIAQFIAEGRQKVKETQQKEREKRVQAVENIKEHYQEKETKMSDRRKAAVLRKRIEKHTKALSDKLLKPADKQHIPEALRKTVAALLENINLESQYTIGEDGKRHKNGEGTPVKRSQLFNKIQEEYAKISENGEMVVDPALVGGEGVQSLFTQAMAMGDTKISEMSSSELDILWQVIRAVEHSISTANKVLSNAKYQATSEWANDILAQSGTRRAMKGKGMEKLRLDLENPYTFFSHYGESGKAIYRMLRDAQDKQQIMTSHIAEEVAKVVDEKTVKKLEKDTHEFKTERGDKLTLTTAHVMEVYLLSKREQAQGHLLKGGIVQPKIDSKKIKRGTDSILLSFDDLQNIIGKLTQEQRDIADALQKLTGTTLAEYGNEASMKAYGYKKFTGENYWTIKSAKEGIHSNIEKGAGNSRSIRNIGLAKNVMPHASNPLDINGIFKTFASHSADMIDYSAWLCPMEDANRLYNFSFRDEMGNQTGKTMKGLLDRVGGIGAQEYWHNLMEDIQNGIKTKEDTVWYGHIGDKLLSNAKSAAVGANIRVIIQQPTAIMRAAMVLSPVDMVQGTLTGGGWKTALKHSAIAQRKDAGGFDIGSPMEMYETLFDGRTAGRKFNDAMMWGAGKADAITWGRIWNACEHNVKHNQPELQKGSKEFYKAVDALFTEVIDQSQVVDGILQRSQLMRASDTWKKYLTSFMGEPTMALNMCIRSYDAWRNQTDKQKRNAALKKLSRSITVLVVTNAVNALAQSIVDAWRDDDKDKGYWSRWYTAFFGITGEEDSTGKKALSVIFQGNLASNINPLNNVPLAKDVVSIMSGYDVTRMDADVMSDVLNSGKKFFDSMKADGKYTKAYGIKEFALNLSKACGISAMNILRDVWGVARSYAVATDDVMMQYQMEKAILKVGNEKNNSAFVNILYRAYNTNQEMYQAIYDDMVSNGIDADKIATGMESRMKKAQGVKKVSDLEERYLSPTQEKEYKQKNKIISNTNLWKSATDGAKNKIEDYLYDIVMDKDSDFVKKVEAAAEVDIDDTEYLLYKLALEMYDKPTENGKYGTFTQEEAENAISELDGLTDAQRAYLWQNTNKGWNEKKNPWK